MGRSPDELKIIAVSKTVGFAEIEQAIAAGVHGFGENRTTPFKERCAAFPQQEWHFIGMIQTNKIKDFVGRAALVHSVASERALRAIDVRMAAHVAQAALVTQAAHVAQTAPVVLDSRQPILIEVNTSGEESKDGISPSELETLLTVATSLEHVEVKGLMTMAPISNESVIRETFRVLRELRDAHAPRFRQADNIELRELSMGMSDDYEIAVEEGATIIRLGRALFARKTQLG